MGLLSNQKMMEEQRRKQIKKKYNMLDAEDKLKGVLITKLINNTNDIIDIANVKKENTKF
mgnify:CR=1 FL=1